nr:reverse transcriptase domain-containing protein [Tanacetum cinerariifolium]
MRGTRGSTSKSTTTKSVGKRNFPTLMKTTSATPLGLVMDRSANSRDPSGCGNPISTSEPILSDSSPSLTPFEGSNFILEEIKAYLKDESISPEINHADCDPKGDICLIEKLLNNDPFQLPLMDLEQKEVAKAKSSLEE